MSIVNIIIIVLTLIETIIGGKRAKRKLQPIIKNFWHDGVGDLIIATFAGTMNIFFIFYLILDIIYCLS